MEIGARRSYHVLKRTLLKVRHVYKTLTFETNARFLLHLPYSTLELVLLKRLDINGKKIYLEMLFRLSK